MTPITTYNWEELLDYSWWLSGLGICSAVSDVPRIMAGLAVEMQNRTAKHGGVVRETGLDADTLAKFNSYYDGLKAGANVGNA